ncbi:MAG: lysostaphin resistance A-like protein [Christensenellales bacterium]
MDNKEKSKKFNLIFVIYLVILLAFVAIRICSGYGLFAKLGDPVLIEVVSTAIIQIGVMFLIPLLMYKFMFKRNTKQVFGDFGFKKLNFKSVLICFAIGILVFFVNLFVASFFNMILSYAGFSSSGSGATTESSYTIVNFLVEVVTVAILPAVCEEFVHRGLLLRGTADSIGYKKAIIISSVLFGLMHLNIQQFFYATILGLLMGFLVSMTRSIWPSIIIHFCNNFINVYFTFAETNNLPGSEFTNILNSLASKNIFLFLILSITIVAVCVIGIIFLVKRLFVETSINSYGKVFEDIENKIRGGEDGSMTDQEVLGAFNEVVFPNMKSPKSLIDFFVADTKKYDKLALKYKIPLIACLFLGIVITLFTFIWGCV